MLTAAYFAMSLTLAVAFTSPLLGSLRVENLVAPLAVSSANPRFSWQVGGDQQTYRITVASSAGQTVWDTGVVSDYLARTAVYSGGSLSADTDYVWTLTTEIIGVGLVEATSGFSTAPVVQGSWLGGFDTLRTSFVLNSDPITRARLHVTGVGCYHVYVNDQRLSAELSPGFAHAPNARVPYDTYDLLQPIQGWGGVAQGENVVGVRIGSCKYGYIGSYCTGTPLSCNAAWAMISITQGSNTTVLYTGSNGTAGAGEWTGANGPILFQHLYHGETYDARLEQKGWSSPGFTPSTPWSPALPMPKSDLGPLVPSRYGPVIRGTQQEAGAVQGPLQDGSYVFDYGRNMAGHCTLSVTGSSGTLITLLHGEQTNADGTVRNTYYDCVFGNISDCANQTVRYTLAGGGQEVYTPHFCYAGFRFVQMWGWPGGASSPPPPSSLVCHFTHSDLPQAGNAQFDPSTPTGAMLNSLQASIVQTHLSNLVSLPTDCPQREKRGWTGDAQLTAHSAILNLDMLAFYENWHVTMLDQQRIGCGTAAGSNATRPHNWACDHVPIANISITDYIGSIGDVVPQGYDGMGLWPGDASWEVAAILIPHELLEQYGDTPWLASNYDGPTSMLRWFNLMATADPASKGLLPWSYLGDWIPIDRTTGLFVANFHYVLGALHAADIATALGHSADASTFLALAALTSDALPGVYWNSSAAGGKGAWDTGSQCAQLLGLTLSLGGSAYTAPALSALQSDISTRGTHLSVGAAGARYLLQVLTAAGDASTALALATSTTYPSWGYFLSQPDFPGTMWESWDWNATVYQENSANHIFKAGGIGAWLYEGALGMGFAHRVQAVGGGASCPCESSLGLPYSLSSRFGLSCAHVAVLCSVVQDRRDQVAQGDAFHDPRAVLGLDSLKAAMTAAMFDAALPPTLSPPPRLLPLLGLTIHEGVAVTVGAAQGWRSTPYGNVTFEWRVAGKNNSWDAPALHLSTSIPCGIQAHVELPLSLLLHPDTRASWPRALVMGMGMGDGKEVGLTVRRVGGGEEQVVQATLGAVGSVQARVEGRHSLVLPAAPAMDSPPHVTQQWVKGAALVLQLACGSHGWDIAWL